MDLFKSKSDVPDYPDQPHQPLIRLRIFFEDDNEQFDTLRFVLYCIFFLSYLLAFQ